MRIAVIGAGWFGCHLACHLLRAGHAVTVYERDGVFAGASGNNQDRVHLGFHYPRSYRTRLEIAMCHDRFVAEYPTVAVADNIYAVAHDSGLDAQTYLIVCGSAGLYYGYAEPAEYGLCGVERAIRVGERVVDTAAVARRFRNTLASHLRREEVRIIVRGDDAPRVNDAPYDAVLNCTNLRLADAYLPVYYEAAMILEVAGPAAHPSFTVMDGAFPTLLATAVPGRYTVSHVTHTAVAKCDTFAAARGALERVDWKARAGLFLDELEKFYPAARRRFEPTGWRGAVRTKPINGTDSRECLTHAAGRVMTVVCGKFMSVYIAESRVDAWLASLSDTPGSSAPTLPASPSGTCG